jgi:digeranylgeranylglycerophospholipid reductase
MAIECDVLVVGAGPAGSSAARAAAQGGAHTIVIDKKEEIGLPVQCAEAIGEYLLPYLPFQIPEEQLVWKIDGMRFWAEDITIERKGGIWSGYAINRANFDKLLSKNAITAGATLNLQSELLDMEFNTDHQVTAAIVKRGDELKIFKPKVVIAADGVHSKVLNELGFTYLEGKTGQVLSFELKNVDLYKPRYEQLYLGDFAPGAYGYIFPLSGSRANVGVGSLVRTQNLETSYEEFLSIPVVRRQLGQGTAVTEKSGWAPYHYIADKWTYRNVLLVGDAANQNFKPFVEGILPGIICGDLAGKTAADFVAGRAKLDTYAARVQEVLGSLFTESDLYLEVLYKLSEIPNKINHLLRLGILSALLPPELEQLRTMDYALIRQQLVAASRQRTADK